MTTTHSSHRPLTAGTSIPVLDHQRRQRRLEHLLQLRAQLAALAAERRAHDLDDAAETFGQQIAVEAAISGEFREVYLAELGNWATRDAELDHESARLSPECGICQVVAAQMGVNLTPPEAA